MTAAGGYTGFVEFRMKEKGCHGVLSSRRGAVDAYPLSIHIGIFFCQRLDPYDPVGEAGVGKILPAYVVKGLAPVGRAHTIDHYYDEPQLCQALHFAVRDEGFGNER